jgi:phosphate transport system permease protein
VKDIDFQDRSFNFVLKGLGIAVLGLFILLLIFLFQSSYPTFQNLGLSFLASKTWAPGNDLFGAASFIYGTLVSSFIALLISVPISIATALFLTELAPKWVRGPVGFLVEMLAAIPSVVYGLWGIMVLAPWMREDLQPLLQNLFPTVPLFSGTPLGVGMLCAGFILAIMITPTITTISREVFKSVPKILREGALALGATKTEMIHSAVLKTGMSGVLGAIILGFGRAVGETMAVTMVIGNRADISLSMFAPGATMASIIANEYAEADSLGLHLSTLTAIGLSLCFISLAINLSARLIISKFRKN